LSVATQNETVTGVLSLCLRLRNGLNGVLQVLLPIEGLVDLYALKARFEMDIAKAEKQAQADLARKRLVDLR